MLVDDSGELIVVSGQAHKRTGHLSPFGGDASIPDPTMVGRCLPNGMVNDDVSKHDEAEEDELSKVAIRSQLLLLI